MSAIPFRGHYTTHMNADTQAFLRAQITLAGGSLLVEEVPDQEEHYLLELRLPGLRVRGVVNPDENPWQVVFRYYLSWCEARVVLREQRRLKRERAEVLQP